MDIIFISIFFIALTIWHSLFLIYGPKFKNKTKIWNLHFYLNSFFWFILLIVILLPVFNFDSYGSVGVEIIIPLIFFVIGFYLVMRSYFILGTDQLMGYRFFFPEKVQKIEKGLFKYLHNPMYDGFILILISLGLLTWIMEYFYLAGVSFISLNLYLASIENYEFNINPF